MIIFNRYIEISRKRILIISSTAAVIITLLAWILISMLNNSVVGRQTLPQITDDFTGKANCSDVETGWSCMFQVDVSGMESIKTWEVPIISAYKNKCLEMGGKWVCYGFCLPEYAHYCDFGYKDSGDLCVSSAQCGGKCLGIFGVGACSEYPVRSCDRYTEIVFGIPIPHEVLCD